MCRNICVNVLRGNRHRMWHSDTWRHISNIECPATVDSCCCSTKVVPEGQVQQSEQSTELDQLSLHPLHLLLEVLMLQHKHKHTQHHFLLEKRSSYPVNASLYTYSIHAAEKCQAGMYTEYKLTLNRKKSMTLQVTSCDRLNSPSGPWRRQNTRKHPPHSPLRRGSATTGRSSPGHNLREDRTNLVTASDTMTETFYHLYTEEMTDGEQKHGGKLEKLELMHLIL